MSRTEIETSSSMSSGSAAKEALDISLGSGQNNSRTGTEGEQQAPGPFGSRNDRISRGDTAPHHFEDAEAEKQPSIATRLGASASGLMNDVLGSSSVDGLTSAVAAGMTHGSKGQSSSNPSGPSESSTAVKNFNHRPDPGIGSSHVPIHAESFRSSSTSTRRIEKQAQDEFNEFMVNGDGPLIADDGRVKTYNDQSSPRTDYKELSGSASNTWTGDDHLPTNGTQSAILASQRGDGAAVVSLLSDPGFSVDDPAAYSEMYDHETAVIDPLLSRMTSRELGVLGQIKAQLPQPPTHRTPAPTNQLNLLPSFEHLSTFTNGKPGSDAAPTLQAEESYPYLIPDTIATMPHSDPSSGNSSEGSVAHLLQWLDVLNRYQDEVWGDMLPLVQDARKEVEQAKNGIADEQHAGPAIRRLAMVFAHLKTSPASAKAGSVPRSTDRH